MRRSVSFDSEQVSTRCVLIATGADYRKLDVPSASNSRVWASTMPRPPTETQLCRGSEVIVVGGGNSAGQAAMFLSEADAARIPVLRDGDLRKSMSSYLADASRAPTTSRSWPRRRFPA